MADGRFFFILIVQFSCNSKKAEKKWLNFPCYQHACLLFEDGKQMTNQSLRERLSIGKNNSAMVSRLIADSVAAGLIKPSSEDTESNKFESYVWMNDPNQSY